MVNRIDPNFSGRMFTSLSHYIDWISNKSLIGPSLAHCSNVMFERGVYTHRLSNHTSGWTNEVTVPSIYEQSIYYPNIPRIIEHAHFQLHCPCRRSMLRELTLWCYVPHTVSGCVVWKPRGNGHYPGFGYQPIAPMYRRWPTTDSSSHRRVEIDDFSANISPIYLGVISEQSSSLYLSNLFQAALLRYISQPFMLTQRRCCYKISIWRKSSPNFLNN